MLTTEGLMIGIVAAVIALAIALLTIVMRAILALRQGCGAEAGRLISHRATSSVGLSRVGLETAVIIARLVFIRAARWRGRITLTVSLILLVLRLLLLLL